MARYVNIINLWRQPVRIGATRIPPQNNNASAPAVARVDISSGRARRDLEEWGHRVAIVGGFSDGVAGRSMNWVDADTDLTAPLLTGQIRWTPLQVSAGTAVNSITYTSGATAAGTPTHQWACVATDNGSGNLVVQGTSPDLLTAAWAASSPQTFTLSTPYTVQSSGVVTYVGLLVAATITPTLTGHNLAAGALGSLPGTNGNDSTTGRTGVLATGTSILKANTTNDGKVPYVVVA